MSERITIELSRDEWIALVTAAVYAGNEVETKIGGHVAGLADRVIEELKSKLNITSIRDEATKIELSAPPTMDLDDIDLDAMNGAPVVTFPIDETFNVGDRVEVKESISGHYQKGERGTVVANLGPYVEVKLDEPRYAIVEEVKVEAQSTSFEPHELAHIDEAP
jgi:hypothetical protein